MKKLFNAIAIVVLAAIGAGAVIYVDNHCPKKQAETQKLIQDSVEKYVDNNTLKILENIAKTDQFGRVIRNYTSLNDENVKERINDYFANNPVLFENYISDNAAFIAQTLAETEEFKALRNSETSAQNTEETETSEDDNKVYKEHWDEMIHSEVAPAVGPENAAVTVVEFFDFACGHCKALAPIVSQIMKNNPDVRFVFNPLYFISEHSPYAAKVALAAAEKGKFVEIYEGIMTLPDMTEETINQILVDEDLNVDEIKKMIEEKKIRRGVQDIDALSQVLGINGVPMLLINGEAFYGRSLEDIQNKINSLK